MKVVSGLREELKQKGWMQDAAPEAFAMKSVYFPLYAAGSVNLNLYLLSDTDLNGDKCTIHCIDVVDAVTNPSFDQSGNVRDNMAMTILKSGFLTISNRKRQELAQIPLTQMVRRMNNGRKFICKFDEQQWDNCYIEFGNVASLSAAVGVQLVVYYTKK